MADALDPDVADATAGEAVARRRVAPYVVAVVAVVMAGLLWVLVSAGDSTTTSGGSPLLGRPAPVATGTYDDGRPFELSRRKGSWVVLNFFTHDCVPCIREHPELIEFADQQQALGADGAELYTIVQNSSREEVAEFFAERGGDWPVVFDDRAEFQNGFGVALVPETWIIDPNGVVRRRFIAEVEAEPLSVLLQDLREGAL